MKVIPPLTITDARLTSSSAVEVPPTLYDAGGTYADGDRACIAGAGGLRTVYESLQSGNTGHAPGSSPDWWVRVGETYQVYSAVQTYAQGDLVIDSVKHLVYESKVAGNTGQVLTNTEKWLLVGPTNRWAMFDLERNTATILPSPLTVVLTPGLRVDSIALLGMAANTAEITVSSDGETVYTKTIDLNRREVLDWYDYFFRPFSTAPSIAQFDIPPYTNAVITITLTRVSGDVECGACVIGSQEYVGDVEAEPESDVLNFSTVERDFAGAVSAMVPRRNVPKTIQRIYVDKARVNRIRALREALNGKPAVWAGIEDDEDGYFEALLILGFYRRFGLNLRPVTHAIASLELEEI